MISLMLFFSFPSANRSLQCGLEIITFIFNLNHTLIDSIIFVKCVFLTLHSHKNANLLLLKAKDYFMLNIVRAKLLIAIQ